MQQALALAVVLLGLALILFSWNLPSASVHRRGGLTFWRIGKVGGSFYRTRRG